MPHLTSTPHSLVNARQRGNRRQNFHLTVVSTNVRGLCTNVDDLSHNFMLRQNADVVAVTETWLNDEVERTFGRISGR